MKRKFFKWITRKAIQLFLPPDTKFYMIRAIDYRITELETQIRLQKKIQVSTAKEDIEIYKSILELLAFQGVKRWRQ